MGSGFVIVTPVRLYCRVQPGSAVAVIHHDHETVGGVGSLCCPERGWHLGRISDA
jgi:hypothetical protein